MKKFVMMIALPGSGKSTHIQKLLAEDDYFVFSTDDYIEAKAKAEGKTYSELFYSCIKEADKVAKEGLLGAYAKGRNVIIDRTNLGVKIRHKLLCNVPTDYRKIGVFFKPPHYYDDWVELYKRLNSRPGKVIDTFSMNALLLSYSKPELSEGFDEIIKMDLWGNHVV